MINKCSITFAILLALEVFAMNQEIDEKESHYTNAQAYFQLASECSEEEQDEKKGLYRFAVQELKEGVSAGEIDSIAQMASFYRHGLYGFIEPNEQKYTELQSKLKDLQLNQQSPQLDLQENSPTKQTLKSVGQENFSGNKLNISESTLTSTNKKKESSDSSQSSGGVNNNEEQ